MPCQCSKPILYNPAATLTENTLVMIKIHFWLFLYKSFRHWIKYFMISLLNKNFFHLAAMLGHLFGTTKKCNEYFLNVSDETRCTLMTGMTGPVRIYIALLCAFWHLRFKRAVRILILTSQKRRSKSSFGPFYCTWKCPRRVGKCICAFGMYGNVKTSTSQWRIQRRFEEFARAPFETKSFYFHGEFSEKSAKNNK